MYVDDFISGAESENGVCGNGRSVSVAIFSIYPVHPTLEFCFRYVESVCVEDRRVEVEERAQIVNLIGVNRYV